MSRWIFRGLGDCNFNLIPSAWRNLKLLERIVENKYTKIEDFSSPRNGNLHEYFQKYNLSSAKINQFFKLVFAEMLLIQEFADLANKSRLPVESIKTFKSFSEIINYWHLTNFWLDVFHSYLIEYEPQIGIDRSAASNIGITEYFCDSYDEKMIAYAQHHGIPTRFLDFTYNPLKAAWFSLYQWQNTTPKQRSSKIAVVAINKDCLFEFPDAFIQESTYFKIVDDFYLSSFNNLYYQEGLFLVMTDANDFFLKHGYCPDLIKYLNYFISYNLNMSDNLIKITLPATETSKLEHILNAFNITKPILMPSYDNVSEYILRSTK